MSMLLFPSKNDQPETAEYLEILYGEHKGESEYAGPIEFHFAQHTDQRGFRWPIPGLRSTGIREKFIIKTNADLPFKENDYIRFHNDKRSTFKIISIVYDQGNNNRTKGDKRRTKLYPKTSQKTYYKIITLE